MKTLTKEYLDSLVKKYETPDFIKDDPIQFPHKFKKQQDIEISGLIASSFAYGSRKKIIETVDNIHQIMDYNPYEYVQNFDLDRDAQDFKGFIYRYNNERDIILLIYILSQVLKEYESLEKAFLANYNPNEKYLKESLSDFVRLLRSYLPCDEKTCRGIFHLLPSPELGSACKRLNLFLKWMIRKPPVDLNIWKNIPADKLLIPLDTHVARLSRKWKLTARKQNDWKTAEEITDKLKEFCPEDPAKYDFAIFGSGVSGTE